MESDWRKFRDLVPVWRERYIAERNETIRRLLDDPMKTDAEKVGWREG